MRPDHMGLVAASICEFVTKGVCVNQGQPRFLRFVGDPTHLQTTHGVTNGCLSVVGTHFKNWQWGCAIVPAMCVVCHPEITSVLTHLVRAMKKAL